MDLKLEFQMLSEPRFLSKTYATINSKELKINQEKHKQDETELELS